MAPYDLIHGTIIGGVVTRFDWQNPHVRVALDVTGEDYVLEHWSVKLENPHILGRAGWTKDTLKPGDRISVTSHLGDRGPHERQQLSPAGGFRAITGRPETSGSGGNGELNGG